MKANKFVITGLKNNASIIPDIKHSIQNHSGINAVRIDSEANTVTVDYDEGIYSEADIRYFVIEAGLNVTEVK